MSNFPTESLGSFSDIAHALVPVCHSLSVKLPVFHTLRQFKFNQKSVVVAKIASKTAYVTGLSLSFEED